MIPTQTHYRPFGIGACVAVSFSLLGVFEERSFFPLLSLCRLITEVSGGLCVVLVIVIYVCAASCRVYPLVLPAGSLLCYRGKTRLISLFARFKKHTFLLRISGANTDVHKTLTSYQAAATPSISVGPE